MSTADGAREPGGPDAAGRSDAAGGSGDGGGALIAGLVRDLGARTRELLMMAPSARSSRPAPSPPVRLELAGGVPGAVVRLVPAVLVLVVTGLADVGVAGWWVGAAAAVGVAWRPDFPVAALFLLFVGGWVFAGPDLLGVAAAQTGGFLRLGALVACVHVLMRATGLAQHVGWRTLVEVPVLWRALRSVLVVQVVVQVLVLATVWVRANLGAWLGGTEWLRLVAVLAVVAAVIVLVPRDWFAVRPERRDHHQPW